MTTTIHSVDVRNRHAYSHYFEDYFRLRHKIFVEERGWTDLRSSDGLEIDTYDNDATTYLLAMEAGRIVGGQRLYPADRPHMLSEVFADLVETTSDRAPGTMEWTRYFVTKERRFGRTDCRLLAAAQQYCLENGVPALLAVVETWWLSRWRQAGFEVAPLGAPKQVGHQECMAVSVAVSPEALASVRSLAGLRAQPFLRDLADVGTTIGGSAADRWMASPSDRLQ